MQTHINRSVVPDGDLKVEAVTGELASVVIGEVALWVSPGDADRLIKAAAEAKRQMDTLRDAAGIAVETLPGEAVASPMAVTCPSCGAEPGQRCKTDFGCMARYYAAEAAS
jgi:hypothetical protein